MNSLELQIQELQSAAKNATASLARIELAVGSPQTLNIQPVLDAIAAIKVAAPEVDFAPVLAAIAAIKVEAPAVDLQPVLDAVAGVAATATEIDNKIGTIAADNTGSNN